MRLLFTSLACVAGGIVSAIKMLAEELRGHVENGRRRFEIFSQLCLTHTQKKIPPATQAITSGVSSRAYHLSHALYFLCPLLKAFPGSITVIKLTTKVSKMKSHFIYINFTFSLCIQLNKQRISSYKCHFAVR